MHIKGMLVLLLALAGAGACAQQKSAAPLKIGDRVPDTFIPNIINGAKKTAHLWEYNDRLLIIDFWATNCSGCVAQLPKQDALQKLFGDKIKMLPVTTEPMAMVTGFLQKNKYTKGLQLPSVVEDKNLSALFRHLYIPHEVWIYKGRLVAITDADYVTENNIRVVLSGGKINWHVKYDFQPEMDTQRSILQVDLGQFPDNTAPLRYAAIFGYRENSGFGRLEGVTYDTVRHTRRDYFINRTIIYAYCTYWNRLSDSTRHIRYPLFPDPNRIILEVKDSYRFLSLQETHEYLYDWHRTHLICYESVSPDTGQSDRQQARTIIADLDYLLGLHGRYEHRKVKSLVLVKTGSPEAMPAETDHSLRRISINEVVRRINTHSSNPPAIDDTGYTGEVDLPDTVWTDIPALRKALHPYGLDIKEEERELQMFVLTEKKLQLKTTYHE